MKRIFSIFCCLSLSVCLFACGDKDKEDVKSAVSDMISNTESVADNIGSKAEDAVSDAMSYEESMMDDFGSENIDEDPEGNIDDDMSGDIGDDLSGDIGE